MKERLGYETLNRCHGSRYRRYLTGGHDATQLDCQREKNPLRMGVTIVQSELVLGDQRLRVI